MWYCIAHTLKVHAKKKKTHALNSSFLNKIKCYNWVQFYYDSGLDFLYYRNFKTGFLWETSQS